MKKKNPLLAKLERQHQQDLIDTAEISYKISIDAATLAANETLQMGEGRAEAFITAVKKYILEINELLHSDFHTDKDLTYSTHVIDQRLQSVVGEKNFIPFNTRYGKAP